MIDNRGSQADALTGVSSDIAEAVELHERMMSGDVMQMQQLDSVPLEASSEIEFEPGGLHVMLVDLKKDLKVGDEFILLCISRILKISTLQCLSVTCQPTEITLRQIIRL